MSIVKIQQVKSLKAVIKYSLQDHKTNEELVTSYECEVETIERDFKVTLLDYNEKNNSDKQLSARMIIQSFDSDDNLTPEQAHQYGVELAENYFKGKHQYAVITHTETDNLHNHIIFNSINFQDLKMFDSSRQHSLYDLRRENDKVSKEHGLSIIENEGKKKDKYLAFNEYVSRAKKKSFKGNLEEVIDNHIQKASTFEEFLQLMDQQGYEGKQGKYLAFKNPKSNKFMRTKTLGINYLESSIKYRIENKAFAPIKQSIIDKEWIDKSQDKFKNNKGLRRWATKKNINYLNEISNQLYKRNITLEELNELELKKDNLIENFEKQLTSIDDEIYKLDKMKDCFSVYKNSYSLIQEYKKAEDKNSFKQENYSKFKQYDVAKRNMNYLRKHYNITDEPDLYSKLSMLKQDRNILYGSLGRNAERQREIERQEQIRKQKQRKNQEIER
ncbi:relaxase/mobilization nuclease domain-containing protein [Metabacillus fastidiosus]|uniref:relaxase/mobilization nuclease domain-containing protein n=1 Tax=Metabacillus fastidiosus TaxID=1458 RepID=UPI002E24AE85|nr:relaxase/mobilization nuclease domain-containing protein [Metabacillus fastidiosus]